MEKWLDGDIVASYCLHAVMQLILQMTPVKHSKDKSHFVRWLAFSEISVHNQLAGQVVECTATVRYNLNFCSAKMWKYLNSIQPLPIASYINAQRYWTKDESNKSDCYRYIFKVPHGNGIGMKVTPGESKRKLMSKNAPNFILRSCAH